MTPFRTLIFLCWCCLLPRAHPCVNLWGQQVEHDVFHYKTTIGSVSRAALDQAQAEVISGFRVLILNNTLYAIPQGQQVGDGHNRRGMTHEALLLLLKALCRHRMPDVEFVMSTQAERSKTDALHGAPVFSYTKDARYQRWDFLYPYWSVLWTRSTHAQMAAHAVPWSHKTAKAVWRGAPSNGAHTPHGWQHTLRAKLVQNCRQRPDLCDAGFYNYRGRVYDDETRQAMKQELGVSKRISLYEQLGYKYLILCDGATAPTSRTVHYMFSNSTVFWQESDLQEFYYTDLKPGVHYIPLTYHVSDLVDKLEWAKVHDDECRQIAQNAYDYATRFTDENLACYWKHLLTEYAALQSFQPSLTPQYLQWKVQPAVPVWSYLVHHTDYPCTQAPYATYAS